MANQGKGDGRAINWSFPMNPTHLPPKSPAFPSSGSGSGTMHIRTGGHKRTPSAGFLPQPSWLDEIIEAPEAPFKRGSHRRSASDSVAFLDSPANFSKNLDQNITEEEEFETQSVVSIHSVGGSLDFDRLDEDQLMSMFGGDIEPFQKQLANQTTQADATMRATCANNAGASSASETWTSERGRTPATTPENPSTPSDSNSVSEVSNEELRTGLGKFKSEPEVQSIGDGDGSFQQFMKGDLQSLSGLDASLDPKRAKRILANRQSAQRSRVRKLQYIAELERSVTTLQTEVSTMSPQVAFFEHRRAVLNVDNNTIKQKMAALSQGQRFKEAHNEALKKEVQRLRQLYQQQQMQQHQQHLQQPQQQTATPSAYDLQQQQFSKLDLGTSQVSEATSGGSDAFTSGMEPISNGNGVAPPTHLRSRSQPHAIMSSSCMLPGTGKSLEGRMMGDFMVHNS